MVVVVPGRATRSLKDRRRRKKKAVFHGIDETSSGKTSNGRTEDSLYLAKGSVEAAGEQVFALASLLACQLFF